MTPSGLICSPPSVSFPPVLSSASLAARSPRSIAIGLSQTRSPTALTRWTPMKPGMRTISGGAPTTAGECPLSEAAWEAGESGAPTGSASLGGGRPLGPIEGRAAEPRRRVDEVADEQKDDEGGSRPRGRSTAAHSSATEREALVEQIVE